MENAIDFNKFTIGAEIEFYLLDSNGDVIADLSSGKFPTKHYQILSENIIPLENFRLEISQKYSFQTESGAGQFEVNLPPTNSAEHLAAEIIKFKEYVKPVAARYGFQVTFAAKPLADQPGSALHIHYCNEAFDPYGLNANKGVYDIRVASNNDYLLWAIGGLLVTTKENNKLFINDENDVPRFWPWFNAPTKICWGGNNRSVAIRVPDAKPKRLEHRIACADVPPQPLIEYIIDAARYGMENKIVPTDKVYGNAWDDKYVFEAIF